MAFEVSMIVFGLIGLVALVIGWKGYKGKGGIPLGKGKTKGVINAVVAAFGVAMILGAAGVISVDKIPLLDKILTPTGDTLSVGGDATGGESTTMSAVGIGTLSVVAKEAITNDFAAVDGFLRVYDKNADPASVNVNPIDSVTVTDGVGSSTNAAIKTGTQYRVVFEGNNTGTSYYDEDLGVMSFDGYKKEVDKLTFSVPTGIYLVGTLDDILDENSSSVNGASGDPTAGTDEVGCTGGCAADEGLLYDESVGDGTWYLDITVSVSGADSFIKDGVLAFKHDLSNPPEGNEFSSIAAQLQSGTDFGIDSELVNYWKNEIPISLGDIKSGRSGTYRLTFSTSEANIDANDDWTLNFDDLGAYKGKDVEGEQTRATADTVTFSGSQA